MVKKMKGSKFSILTLKPNAVNNIVQGKIGISTQCLESS